ncbi:MAG TPA: protein translocase subunit SecF [Thermoanaerobaculia bacterium]|nr:protein translocase subunit SecF [Thermoanaerobaculia bacterium]
MQIFVNPKYDFVKYRFVAMILSLLIILAGAAIYFTRGINLGIDFKGGANIVLKFASNPPLGELRSTLPSAVIQQYGAAKDNSVLIRLPQQRQEGDYAGAVVTNLHAKLNPQAAGKHDLNYLGTDSLAGLLQQADPDKRGTNAAALQHYRSVAERVIARRSELGVFTSMQQVVSVQGVTPATATVLNERAFLGRFNLLNQETVGPQVGKELQQKAFWAIVLSSLAMAIYIAFRFEGGLVFGAASLVSIIHDVLIAMTFVLIMRLEFSLNVVAALLTLVGYSINDTVVMYDRVRENKRKTKQPMTLAEHINKGINDTLSRTILTAGTVLVVLVSLILFGGEVIRGFSWVLFIGLLSGTYSTLFIVPAVVVAWDNWKNRNRRQPAVASPAARTDVRDDVTNRKRKAS